MPKKTPIRQVRVPNDLYEKLVVIAKRNNRSLPGENAVGLKKHLASEARK